MTNDATKEFDNAKMSGRRRGKRVFRFRRERKEYIRLASLGLFILFVLSVGAGFLAYPFYNRAHQVPIECTVVSADSGTSRSGGGRGVTSNSVIIHTQECGRLSMMWGDPSSAQKVVDQLEPGETYEFKIGEISLKIMPFLLKTDTAPSVHSFEKIDSNYSATASYDNTWTNIIMLGLIAVVIFGGFFGAPGLVRDIRKRRAENATWYRQGSELFGVAKYVALYMTGLALPVLVLAELVGKLNVALILLLVNGLIAVGYVFVWPVIKARRRRNS